MSDKDLIARGAELVTGDLIFRGRSVGRYRNGVFEISAAGKSELDAQDVAVKPSKVEPPVVKPSKAGASAVKPYKAGASVAAAPLIDDMDMGDINDLLNA